MFNQNLEFMFNVPQKIHAGFILTIAFLLVLSSNLLYQRHFSRIQTTVNSVHIDRVIVQDFIYQLNNIFHQKEIRFVNEEYLASVASENKKVEKLLFDFGKTNQTINEYNFLNELIAQFKKLKKLEENVIESHDNLKGGVGVLSLKTLQEMAQNLDALAKIQVEESEHMTLLSKKSLDMNILLSKLEVAFLIIIGTAMLALVFYPLKTKQPVPE
jgi:hypothetical protein